LQHEDGQVGVPEDHTVCRMEDEGPAPQGPQNQAWYRYGVRVLPGNVDIPKERGIERDNR